MTYRITAPETFTPDADVSLPASKSISNRLLILDALTGFKSTITNLSKANDTAVLKRMLKSANTLVDAEDVGTALRFAAVYFSLKEGEHVITGTERLMNRPMQPLLDALKHQGGKATLKKTDGKKSLVINGGKLKCGEVTVDGSESSQFVSALLLCGAAMENGLVVNMKGSVVSQPYIDMTLELMNTVKIDFQRSKKKIVVPHQSVKPFRIKVENDWSSASYFYALLGCMPSGALKLNGLVADSVQGDAVLMKLMEVFGIRSKETADGIEIEKKKVRLPKSINIDAKDFPDLVPALAVAGLCNNIEMKFKGVGHLRLKESDRVAALVATARQIGAKAKLNGRNGFTISPAQKFTGTPHLNSYDDHRMAMAFAALATRFDSVTIENALVVKKSFPDYWSELKKPGFTISGV